MANNFPEKISRVQLTNDKTYLIVGYSSGKIELCDLENFKMIEYPRYIPDHVRLINLIERYRIFMDYK